MNAISRGQRLAVGLILVWSALTGCGSSGDLGGPPPLALDKAPTENGDQQTGPVGTPLPNVLRVLVTRDGTPEGGVSVTWSAAAGSVQPGAGTTGADGISTTTWTLGAVAGAQSAQAVVSGATGSPVTFTATATADEPAPPPPPPPSPLVLAKAPTESGDGQTGPVGAMLANELRVLVTRDGVAQPGVTVMWGTTDGSLDPPSDQTGTDGIATSSWTLGSTAGAQSATAVVAGANGSPVTFVATATAGEPPPPPPPPPSSVQVTVGNDFFKSVANGTQDPAVDTVAVNGTVKWTWVSTGTTSHSVESNGTTTFTSSQILSGNGQTYSFKFTQAGTYTYDCAIHGSLMTGRIVVR